MGRRPPSAERDLVATFNGLAPYVAISSTLLFALELICSFSQGESP